MKRYLLLYLFLAASLTIHGNIYFKHLGKSEGLSQISVVSICQDELGRMWFGTLEGLNCYDGNRMTVYKPSLTGKDHFGGNEIQNLVSDKQGSIFFISDGDLIRYDLFKDHFTQLDLRPGCLYAQEHTIWAAVNDSILKWNKETEDFDFIYSLKSHKRVTCLYVDVNNCMWIGTIDGLYRIDNLNSPSPVCVISHIHTHSLYRDKQGRMWVAAYRKGMYKIENGVSQQFAIQKDFDLSNNDVRCFVEDNEGSIWIGTFNGLNKIDSVGNVSYYNRGMKPGNLKHSSVFSLYKDLQGTIWVGTYYGGVHYFNPEVDIFRHYSEDTGNEDGLSFPYVGNMVEDKRGDVWICTEGGGLNHLSRKTGCFTHYLMDNKSYSEPFYNLKCIAYDKEQDCLYIGTHKQGFLCFDISTKKVKYHSKEAGDTWVKMEFKDDKLYLMSTKGMFIKERGDYSIKSLYPSTPEANTEGTDFLIDSQGYLWISRWNSITRISMTNPQEKQIYRYGKSGLGKYHVTKMTESKDGTIFMGTYGDGIYAFNRIEKKFIKCADIDASYCYNMIVTPHGYLAISNDRGLLIYHPQTGEKKMIDAESQLHLSAINDGCGLLLCKDGETFIGGAEGLSSFMSSSLSNTPPSYNLYFSSLIVNNKPIAVDDSENILKAALPFVHQIDLGHNENNLSVSFTSNNYVNNTSRKVYEYKLEGFSKEWATTYGNTIVFTNLNPGKYKLVVREQQQSSRDKVSTIELPIIIHHPWWATWWAYLIYICIVSAIAWIIVINWRSKMRLRASLAQEKMEKEKNEELTQAKLQFFANISHEFRTPLTLIISQIESLLQTGSLSPFLRTRLQKIYKNTFQFRELISELLDFRKMERGKLNLHVCQLDMIPYLQQIYQDFTEQAQLQNLQFEFHAEAESLMCWCDGRQLRKVFSNLLSNAFKHTPEEGKVELQIEEKETVIEIKVIDSGEGIPQEALPYIFDRFYQVDSAISSPGSGIGLALSKGLVELHHGEIIVKSALQYGTIFTVTLPKENLFQNDTYVTFTEPENSNYRFMETSTVTSAAEDTSVIEENEIQENVTSKDCILLVEDNEELLQILTSLLSPLYRVVIAMNGKEGLAKTLEEHPDLILSDIMMPEMDGIEMCTKIKNNFDLCHIPVILLTALTSDNKKMEGLQCGADDYIEKPFNNKMLLGHIANILRNRKLLKQKFGKDMTDDKPEGTELQTLALSPIDAKFLAKLEEIVKAQLSNPDFDVNTLASELAVSRSSLYNKLRALSCMSPNEYILNMRLKHAADLLKNHPELQITDIAFQVGFNSLRYFRHCFKACFNQTPQEYKGK